MRVVQRATRRSIPRLYAILDRNGSGPRPPGELARALAQAGVRLIQYRDKKGSSRQIFEASQAIAGALEGSGCIFIVNDRADIARAIGAAGVHVGRDDLPVDLARRVLLPRQMLGVSTHNLEQAAEAEASSADYVAIGPIFPTASKERPDPVVGLEGLKRVRRVVKKPLVAIGGISLENAKLVIEAGADSVAVIGSLMESSDVGKRAVEFLRELEL
jgi:thiamine-phosphate pyrophosphorylase